MRLGKRNGAQKKGRIKSARTGNGLSPPPALAKLAVALREGEQLRQQQAATAEILKVIAASPSDVQPVFRAVAESAARLCHASNVHIRVVDGDVLRLAVHVGDIRIPAAAAPIKRTTAPGRAVLERKIIHIHDVTAPGVRAEYPDALFVREKVLGGTFRTLLVVPLIRDGAAIGTLSVRRREKHPFSEDQIALLKTFADQAVIAIENARLFNETKAALEQQTATAEILRVIAASPSDTQPVFEAIARSAQKLLGAHYANVARLVHDELHLAAHTGASATAEESLRKLFPAKVIGEGALGRAVLSKQAVCVADVETDPTYSASFRQGARQRGYRSLLAVPMLRDGACIGTIAVTRREPGPFSDDQIGLLRTFADQAVIAIENVRLFNETKEALERQTATAEILRVISQSQTDTQPVFDAIVRSAVRLCAGSFGALLRIEGETIRLAAYYNPSPEAHKLIAERFPAPLSEHSLVALAARTGEVVHSADTANDARAHWGPVPQAIGVRAQLTVPLLREGKVIAALNVSRTVAGPFSETQIEMLKTFADQAVIAIENVRLFNETKEALEQQTATADILKVISTSTANVQPVFDTIIGNAVRLGRGAFGAFFLFDGHRIELAAHYNFSPEVEALYRRAFPQPPSRDNPVARAILDRRRVNVADILETDYSAGAKSRAQEMGTRAVLAVPLMRQETPIGVIAVIRREAGAFSDSYVSLLETFADQAVIAIENVRLFNETKEALEQQTAISEVLRVISSSPADVQPVLEAVAERAAKICASVDAQIFLRQGEEMKHVASFGPIPFGIKLGDARPLSRGWAAGRAVLEGRAIHIEDLLAVPREEYPVSHELRDRAGHRTLLSVPLMRERRALGAISLRRMEVRPFTDKQIALLNTFADQAAIAIENVRLFNETKESLDQQKASSDVLAVISSSIADTKPVFDKILESCVRLFEGYIVGIGVIMDDGLVHIAAYHGPQREEFESAFPVPVSEDSATGRAILSRQVVHYPDVLAGADVPFYMRRSVARIGGKSAIVAPMLWEGRGVGGIFIARDFIGPFTEKEIALLKTFADQAAIAIQNARLFREIQEKSAQLEVANKHKSDFLANMSHELRTPLNAIIGFSEALMDRMFGEVNEKQADYLKDIHESGRHLLSLINDILDLSKIEAGRMELDLSRFHLPSALANAMTLIRERAQRHGIQLALDVDQRLGEFQADERKFKQIMLNLLSNAVKFTPDGGRVDVCARKDTDKIEIAVKDTGIGIAPEDQAVVFEEFKQVGRDQMRKAEGTGLGLALTKRFVELHGGAIRLESTPGKGSTFTVSLPLR